MDSISHGHCCIPKPMHDQRWIPSLMATVAYQSQCMIRGGFHLSWPLLHSRLSYMCWIYIYIYIYGDVYFVSVSRMGYQIHHGTFATEWLWKILFSRFAGGARAAHAPGACAGSFKRRFPAMSPSPATWLCPFHAGGYASLPPPSACRCQQNSCCEAPACMAVEVFRGAPPSKFPITETK